METSYARKKQVENALELFEHVFYDAIKIYKPSAEYVPMLDPHCLFEQSLKCCTGVPKMYSKYLSSAFTHVLDAL